MTSKQKEELKNLIENEVLRNLELEVSIKNTYGYKDYIALKYNGYVISKIDMSFTGSTYVIDDNKRRW